MLEVNSGFHHSSDLDPNKPVNWKRQVKTCGEIGVMGDLGMQRSTFLPPRLESCAGLRSAAENLSSASRRQGGNGAVRHWDNALLHTDVRIGDADIPLRLEMKRTRPW